MGALCTYYRGAPPFLSPEDRRTWSFGLVAGFGIDFAMQRGLSGLEVGAIMMIIVP